MNGANLNCVRPERTGGHRLIWRGWRWFCEDREFVLIFPFIERLWYRLNTEKIVSLPIAEFLVEQEK